MHNQPSLYQQKGQVLLNMHRWQDAEAAYHKVLEIDPVNSQGQFGLAQCYLFQRGLEQQALDAISASLGLVYHNPRGHYLCGVALQRLQRQQEAIKAFEVAIVQNPVYPAAHHRLSRLYKKSDLAKSREHQGLARAAIQRIIAFKAGKPLPNIHEADLEFISLDEMVSLGDLGTTKILNPLADNELVIVSGLPRSGTSMMMQMLKAGGLPLLTDNKRQANEDNLKGYFEFEQAKIVGTEGLWLSD